MDNKSLLTELQTNKIFRNCVDTKLDIHNISGYDDFMDDVSNQNFKMTDKHVKFIESASKNFTSLTPDDIKDCLDKLEYSVVLKKQICEGKITLTMMESIILIFEFIGIHIDFKDLNPEYIIELTPVIKSVFNKVIETSEYFEQVSCNGKTSDTTKNLKTLYHSLFETHNTIEYPFKDFELKWLKDFTTTFYGKVVLLIFIAFIFSQMVQLFSSRGEVIQK